MTRNEAGRGLLGRSGSQIRVRRAGRHLENNAVCHQVTTLDRAKLSKRTGALPAELVAEVNEGLRAAMDLD